MLLYYITDRRQFPGTEAEQRRALLDKISEAAAAGVDLIQLRERDLSGRALERLAADAVAAVRSHGTGTRLLVNSRVDVALAADADGVHLRSQDIAAADARAMASGRTRFTIGVSCHTVEELRLAWSHGADLAVFAPVFAKAGRPGNGLPALREACAALPSFTVLALGGITAENTAACLEAGAKGVAGIRLFQTGPISTLVSKLRQTGIPKIGPTPGKGKSKSQT